MRKLIGYGWASLILLTAACGGKSDFGGEVRVPPEHRHVIKAADIGSNRLELPASDGFNIHIKQSGQNPGASGTAKGNSEANPSGDASCEVKASEGGTATAQFNLGHRIDNNSTEPKDLWIRLKYTLEQEISASPDPAIETVSSASLVLVVIDSDKRMISKTPVISMTSDDVRTTGEFTDNRSILVRFEPEESYDVMLYGRVDTTTAESNDQNASARLAVRNLKMDITAESASTRPAG